MATPGQRLYDLDTRHQIGIARYSTATVRKMLALIGRTEADIVEQIEKLSWDDVTRNSSKADRLKRMLEAMKVTSREGALALGRELKKELQAFAGYEAEFQGKLLTEVDIGFSARPTSEQLNAAVNSRPFQGRLLREWVKDLDEASFRRLRDQIRIGYVEGESVANVVKRVRGTAALGFKDGVMEISRRGAEALVRTAITHTANAAKEEFFAANPSAIRGVRWSSVLDSRTTPVCRARDGKVYPVGEGPRPPAHIRCRSTTVAVLNGEPDAPETETYQGWLKRQPTTLQDDILGKAKGQLFRKGALDLDRFVDRSGKELTLEQLRRTEAAAFEKAGLSG
jgi:SPP1 gp7 family putative phage head morphogenesis protein